MPYMESRNLSVYSPDVGASYLDYMSQILPSEHVSKRILDHLRAVRLLDDMLAYGEVRSHREKKLPPLYGKIGAEMIDFLYHLKAERRSKNTVNGHHRFLLHFLNYLSDNNITELSAITPNVLFDYFSTDMPAKKHALGTVRYAFNYWFTFGKVDGPVLKVFDMIKILEKEPLVSVYQEDEIAQIIKSVRHCDPVGKRNYAMLMLAVYYGLRASDIAALKIDNLDFDKNKIKLIMVKTGKFISLPMRAEVGNALKDYLLNGRVNKSKTPYVFLASVAPFKPVTNKCVSTTLRLIIAKSGVNTNGRKSGPHIFRHSLASSMLYNNESYPVISEVLGHVYTPTTMEYLRIDITSMLKCALEVPAVPDEFYSQKGGIFYES